ncbi:MAG TPA: hypothetical protein VHS09_02540 [Polyangiaceae bacterium]|jgi:hypothetical protein|nr:hypothetical protein [Polyangiaceae bacterium]
MTPARVALASLVILGCGRAAVNAPASNVAPKVVAPAPAAVTVDGVLARTPDEGSVLLRLSVARQHPLGSLLVPFVLAWPGWGDTLASLTRDPIADIDWIDVVGPKDPARERMILRTAAPDDAVDARLAARGDGSLRVVARAQPHLVAALPPDGADAVLQVLRSSRLAEPDDADADEVLHVDFPHPHGAMLYVPANVRRAVVRADSRPGGAAEGFADLTFDDDATAARMAGELRARAESMNSLMVRVLTRDLLGGLVVTAEGPVVKLRLPATKEQLESLATLASAMLPGSTKH